MTVSSAVRLARWLIFACAMFCTQPSVAKSNSAELRLRIVFSNPEKHAPVPGVAWLHPLPGTPASLFTPAGPYILLQKNRTFTPHLQVVPVGAVVQFPNADPLFHNVFSLFDGKRFDLGLYEAGASKSVAFTREGVSYIFCNIHPEMSAVIISLSTSLYGIADSHDLIDIADVPPGDYQLEFWIEGVPRSVLAGFSRHVHLGSGRIDLGEFPVPFPHGAIAHTNKFGAAYTKDPAQPY